jgi:hypothetical protein
MNKPTELEKEIFISSLQNLASNMVMVSILLKRFGRKDLSSQLVGASKMVDDWVLNAKQEYK